MRALYLLAIFSFTLSSFAADKLPRPFPYAHGLAVFADFKTADYQLTYDVSQKTVLATAEINLETHQEGYPVFDSVVDPSTITLDGVRVTAALVRTPGSETFLRVIDHNTTPGVHTLRIELPVKEFFEFSPTGVKHALWMGDLRDRDYLERFLPANLLFDRVAMSFTVKIIGATDTHKIYANGVVASTQVNEFKVSYPENFNSSCPFFHLVPVSSVHSLEFSYDSLDGRSIPVVIYMENIGDPVLLEKFKAGTITIMNELEADYGAFPHPTLTIYSVPEGGMEYAGATATSLDALGHELFHSYFARAALPEDGNSGWVDEALASWRDYGYRTQTTLEGTTNMADHGYYNRVTDMNAYGFGQEFFSYLSSKVGDLKPFMKDFVTHRTFAPFGMDEFIAAMNVFYGMDLTPEFRKFVFKPAPATVSKSRRQEHPVHKHFTRAQLIDFL
ncbi:MAG TPA: hypothetical protein VNJ01_11700 [Bacteriovoracaceae bacterium]|nr:hypothetical protein [Bacteriovoracaceae bacterium]